MKRDSPLFSFKVDFRDDEVEAEGPVTRKGSGETGVRFPLRQPSYFRAFSTYGRIALNPAALSEELNESFSIPGPPGAAMP